MSLVIKEKKVKMEADEKFLDVMWKSASIGLDSWNPAWVWFPHCQFVLRLLMKVLSASFKQAEKKVENDLVAVAQWLNKAQDHCNRQAHWITRCSLGQKMLAWSCKTKFASEPFSQYKAWYVNQSFPMVLRLFAGQPWHEVFDGSLRAREDCSSGLLEGKPPFCEGGSNVWCPCWPATISITDECRQWEPWSIIIQGTSCWQWFSKLRTCSH